jgi:diguanylate cyclase (GGDEF)-like protein
LTLAAIIFGLVIKLGFSLFELRRQSRYDGLSQVYNRYTLELVSDDALISVRKHHGLLSVIMFDIDNFKHINDNYGHRIGDEGIRFFGNIIRDNVRKTDIVGRYGGEEFVVTLPDTSIDVAVDIAEKIRRELEHTPFTENTNLTVSAGCCEYLSTEEDYSFLELCEKADLALYQSKRAGKNRVTEYNEESKTIDKRHLT